MAKLCHLLHCEGLLLCRHHTSRDIVHPQKHTFSISATDAVPKASQCLLRPRFTLGRKLWCLLLQSCFFIFFYAYIILYTSLLSNNSIILYFHSKPLKQSVLVLFWKASCPRWECFHQHSHQPTSMQSHAFSAGSPHSRTV